MSSGCYYFCCFCSQCLLRSALPVFSFNCCCCCFCNFIAGVGGAAKTCFNAKRNNGYDVSNQQQLRQQQHDSDTNKHSIEQYFLYIICSISFAFMLAFVAASGFVFVFYFFFISIFLCSKFCCFVAFVFAHVLCTAQWNLVAKIWNTASNCGNSPNFGLGARVRVFELLFQFQLLHLSTCPATYSPHRLGQQQQIVLLLLLSAC